MRIIPSMEALNRLDEGPLKIFMTESSPWLREEGFDARQLGYTFLLEDLDWVAISEICIVPHIPIEEEAYRFTMTINLSTFKDYEYVTYDEQSKHYHAVMIMGAEYGASIFMSEPYVASIPNLMEILNQIIEQEDN